MSRCSFRNLRRWLFVTFAVISLVLCLATVASWVRSYWRWDLVTWPIALASRHGAVVSRHGRLQAIISEPEVPDATRSAWNWETTDDPHDATSAPSRTFYFFRGPRTGIGLPHWSLALLLAIAPTWWLTPIIRARRRPQPGCCAICGYDLRASPERCPECGTAAIQDAK